MLALITTVEPQSTVGSCTQVKLDASKSVGDIVKYEWSVSQGGILTGQTGVTNEFVLSPTYSGSLPADFYVKLVVTNRQGATQSDSIPIKVDSLPDVAFYSAGTLEADGSMIVDTIDSSGTISEFRWFSPEGKIIGPNDRPSVRLFGPGTYTLEITDLYGCKAAKNYTIPAEVYQIIVNPDYAAILWAKDTTLMVLENDQSVVSFIIGSVQITRQPARGSARVNTNGSITYLPDQLQTGRDQFVYEVCNSANICASATVTIDIYEIGIVIPNGFSPNGDGINEKLEFLRLENYLQTKLYVYTRSGQLVYQSDDYKNDWDGATIQSSLTSKKTVPTGIYFYVLKPGGTNRLLKGFVYIGY